jgi:hypothetical protein
MTIFPEFEQQLRRLGQTTVRSGAATALPPSERHGWWRRPARVVAIIASVAVVIGVVAVVVGLGGHHPQPPNHTPGVPALTKAQRSAEMRYTAIAQRRADRLAVCQQGASTVKGGPPLSLVGKLAAVRERSSPLVLHGLMAENFRHLYPQHSRLASQKFGNEYWIVTVTETSNGPVLTQACQIWTIAELKKEYPQIPVRLRASTLALLHRQLRFQRQFADPAVCLLVQYPGADASSCSSYGNKINKYGLVMYYGQLNGVVPDGVASVLVRYHDPNTHAIRTTTARVLNNVFATQVSPEISPGHADAKDNPIITWKAADGHTLKTVNAGRSISGGACGGRNTHLPITPANDPCRAR